MDSPSVFSREDGTRVGELFCKSCPDMALIGRSIDWNEVCWDVKLVGCSDSARFVGVRVLFKFPVIPSANLSLYEDRKNIYIYKKNSIILL